MSTQAKARRIAVLGTRAVGNYLIKKKKKKADKILKIYPRQILACYPIL